MPVLYKSLPFVKFKNEQHKAIVAAWYAGLLLDKLVSKMLESFDISLEQFRILYILQTVYPEAIPVYTINHYLPVRSDLSRTITALHKRGLVEKSMSKKDKRVVPVLLSHNGLELIQLITDKYLREVIGLPVLTELEAAETTAGMEKLIECIQRELKKYD